MAKTPAIEKISKNSTFVEQSDKYDTPFDGKIAMRYAILSQQRTGSNVICGELINAGGHGVPGEYLHPRVMRHYVNRFSGPKTGTVKIGMKVYLDQVGQLRTTQNGVFGVKIQPYQLFPQFKNDGKGIAAFLSAFDKVLFLSRSDTLMQAVSGTIGQLTNKWRNYGEKHDLPDISDDQMVAGICQTLGIYLKENVDMRAVLKHVTCPQLEVTYEDMLRDRAALMKEITGFLDVADLSPPQAKVELPSKPPSGQAEALRDLFLARIQGRQS